MKMGLIRHAEAVDIGEAGTTNDYDRMLTEHGREQAQALATSLQRLGIVPGLILSSPLVRAWQTAEIVAATLTPGREPMHCQRLASGERRFNKLTKEVIEFNQPLTFLVGHMPDIGDFAAWLLGSSECSIDFDKSAMALIKFANEPEKAGGELKWLVTPAWFDPS